jgi:uncharacterized protein (DUF1501 family)
MLQRREFLRLAGAAGVGAAAATGVPALLRTGQPSGASKASKATTKVARTVTKAPTTAAAKSSKEPILVVIDLAGGNDGINTLVPVRDPAYRKVRTKVALPENELIPFGKEFALHPKLQKVSKRTMAVVAGVGVAEPDGSHFEMQRRWATGDVTGRARPETGFLGRLADVIGSKDAPAVALLLGNGSSPSVESLRVPTVSLGSLYSAEMFRANREDAMLTTFQDGFRRIASTAAPAGAKGNRAHVGIGMGKALSAAGLVAGEPSADEDRMPDTDLGRGLGSALRLLRQPELGLRIITVTHDGYDHHEGLINNHATRMQEFDDAVDAFLGALEKDGIADRVLVATTSEFGRRVNDNGTSGLDHGAASVSMLFGPVKPGVHGEYPSLSKLDKDDNLKATVTMGTYLSTLASWVGVTGSDVGLGKSETLSGVLAKRG